MKNYKLKFLKYSQKCKNVQKGGGKCIVCMERSASIVSMPCSHLVFCKLCASQYLQETCPMCKEKATFYAIPDEKSMEYIDIDMLPHTTAAAAAAAVTDAAEETQTQRKNRQIPFNRTIDFLIYNLIATDHFVILDDENNIVNNADILLKSFMKRYPNIFAKINSSGLLPDYMRFILKKEIDNKKIVDEYDKEPKTKMLKVAKVKELNDNIFNPMFLDEIEKWNEICRDDINNIIGKLIETNEHSRANDEIKRDTIYALDIQIQQLFNNLSRRAYYLH